MNVQEVSLDLSKESPGYPIVRIGQGDSSGTTIRATVYDNGSTPTLTGMTVKMHMRLPDGKSYAEGGNCSVSGNVITCVVDESRFAVVDGYTNDAYFSLTTGTTIYSTSRFRVKVEKAASKDADPAGMYTDDVVAATTAARAAADAATEAIEQIGTAVDDAQQAADDAAQAVTDAQTAIQDADAAKQSATTAASQATAAANQANQQATNASNATTQANAATSAANDATTRANSAIDAMGDISEQAVPVMSADVRGGAKIQPDSGLEISGTDNLQVRLALESEGDVRGGLAQVTAKGHAEQVTTTGKNLLPNDATSQTINGVTVTVNADGSITLNGTASAGTSFDIKTGISLPSATYTLSSVTKVPLGAYLSIQTDAGNKSVTGYANSETFSAAPSGKSWMFISSGTVLNNLTIYPQLELGSTATDYEPYTGGLPSPRPDWEQPIEVVRGRNLLDESTLRQGDYNNTLSVRVSQDISHRVRCKAGETYAISLQSAPSNFFIFASVTNDSNMKIQTDEAIRNGRGSYTIKTDGYLTLVFGYSWAGESTPTITPSFVSSLHPQLELGSTPTPYVPYGHVGMELTVEKAKTIDGLLSNGSIAQYGTKVHVFKVAPNVQYTLVRNGGNRTRIAQFDEEPIVGSTGSIITNIDTALNYHAFTPTEKYVGIYLTGEVGVSIDCVLYVNDYATTPIPLPQRGWVGSLRDGTADVLTLNGAGKCEWEKACEEYTITGSETYDGSQIGNYYRIAAWTALISKPCKPEAEMSQNLSGLFTHAPFEINWAKQSNHAYCFTHSLVLIAEGSSKEDVLAQYTGAKLLYPLATPVTEDMGYVEDWPTDLPEGCVVSCPELDELGVRYFIDSSVTELAKQWYERAQSEYDDRIASLEETVAELIAG